LRFRMVVVHIIDYIQKKKNLDFKIFKEKTC
jgi:hypothetical protein